MAQTVVGAARHQPERARDSLGRPRRRRQPQRLQPRLLAPRRDGREHVRLRAGDAAPDTSQTREEPRAVDVEDGVFPRGSRRAAAAEIDPASQPRDDGRRPELNLDGPDGLHGRPVRPDDDARGDEPRRRERDGAVDRVNAGRRRRDAAAAAAVVRKDASSGTVGEPRG